jgi:ribonucleoside-diphosphate reductase alpha chain
LTGTTTGIEPIYAVAYKRRWIDGDARKYQLVIDQTAADLIADLGIDDPDRIETAIDLAADPERRIAFQADMQEYVDMAISSTLNMPAWNTELNNDDRVPEMAKIISEYAPRLRGLTFYPDGARGGQPLTKVPYAEAKASGSAIYEEHAETACKSGVCGV